MKKLIILLSAVSVLAACKNKDEFSITGKIENPGDVKKVLLYETDQLIDSAFLNESNEFRFRRIAPDPNFYSLVLGEKNFLVVAKNGDEIEFETDLSDTTNTYEIDGSAESEKIREFNKISNDYGKIYQQIQEEYSSVLAANPQAKDSIYNALMPRFQENMEAYSKAAIKFANDNKDNLAGFYAIGTIDQARHEETLIKYAEDIKSKYPNNKSVQAFVNRMMEIKPVSVGQQAPAFELPTPAGETIKLSDYKGKYVLLDFWASWCGPCREENPNIVKQYASFKDRGFDILGISLDDNKSDWLKAIEDDNLAWGHVSELKRWDGTVATQYKVEGIPASFILDPAGKIIAKNLRGPELKEFLNKTLK